MEYKSKKYRLTCVTTRFVDGAENRPNRWFDAPGDAEAIQQAEHPEYPLKVIDPHGGAPADTRPVELVELTDPPRLVKRWE